MNDNLQCLDFRLLYQKALDAIKNDPQVMREVERARILDPRSTLPADFLREYAWVVFNSGMKMQTIRRRWPGLQNAFKQWDHRAIVENEVEIRSSALQNLNHPGKVDAVIRLARMLSGQDWRVLKREILDSPIIVGGRNLMPPAQFFDFTTKLPWLKEANKRYFAKNLGFDLAKNDRHLRQLASEYGYAEDGESVQQFVEKVSECVCERISVVETVLWNACEKKAI